MTSDPNSILVDKERTGELVSRLAMNLVTKAREEGLEIHDVRSGPSRSRFASETESLDDEGRGGTVKAIVTSPSAAGMTAAASLGQVMGGPPSATFHSRPKSSRVSNMAALASPLLGAFSKAPRSAITPSSSATPIHPAPPTATLPVPQPNTPAKPRAGTVELESIIPALAKPPTLFLARSSLASPSFRPSFPHSTASRFTVNSAGSDGAAPSEQPQTDRYGFIYDVSSYYVKMLMSAKEASSTAPASLTGIKVQEIEDDDDGWPSEGTTGKSSPHMEVVHGRCESCEGSQASSPRLHGDSASHPEISVTDDASEVLVGSPASPSARSSKLPASLSHSFTHSQPSVSLNVDSTHGLSSDLTPAAAPVHACGSTISLLLAQLTEMHDKQQETQKADWDAFLRRRKSKAVKTVAASSSNSGVSSTNRAAALLGWGIHTEDEEVSHTEGLIGVAQMGLSANKEDWKEFSKLVRSGAPLVYRPKVWLECSGAMELMEPGVYQDLLSNHEGVENPSLIEIEKDVTRTMPLNIFFGGDGVGVGKLRRVLQAYSWYVLAISYLTRN